MSQSGDYGRSHRPAAADPAQPGAAVLAAIGTVTNARRRAWSDHRIMEYIPG